MCDMGRQDLIRRMCRNGLFLALLCVMGMFSIPLGENIKVSLQLLLVFVIALLADGAIDTVIVTGCYALLGLFLPIYAGFSSGITPTFGFVLGFIVAAPGIYFFNKIKAIPSWPRMLLACLLGLIPVYGIGTLFLMFYLSTDIAHALMVAVVPYLPFDAVKIVLAVLIAQGLPALVQPRKMKKERTEEKGDSED